MTAQDAYQWLLEHHRETAYLEAFASLAGWDQATYTPPKGHEHRARMFAVAAKLFHERHTHPKIAQCLEATLQSSLVSDPASESAVNLRGWQRAFHQASRTPARLAVEMAEAHSQGQAFWSEARPRNDWKGFKPYLERNIRLARELAQALGYTNEPYDALLDLYEPGATTAQIEPIFEQLRQATVGLLDKIKASPHQPRTDFLSSYFPRAAQETLAQQAAAAIGFDMEAGRIDPTAHPFAQGIGPGDVRLTTRYDESFFNTAFFGVLHEAGHGIYGQGLLAEHFGSPMGSEISLGMHESQSRTWENLVGRSLGFWQYFYPQTQRAFPLLEGVSLEEFHFAVNQVTPSLIRVEADEVTYNLHILIRFELELALLRNQLSVDDLPEAWDSKYQAYLGVRAPNVADGVMQDVHWSAGLLGYFPTYSLGNLYGAQLFARAQEALGPLEEQFAGGQFAPLLNWSRQHIHQQGSRYQPRDLLKQATGQDLNPQYLIDYLERKYGALYGF
jgi:carboxypeptidase Taq